MNVSFDTSALPDFPVKPETIEQIGPGSKVLIIRAGGLGDHVMLLPALQAFRKSLHPTVEVWLVTQRDMFPVFEGNSCVDQLYPLPTPLSELLEADYVVDFSGPLNEALGPNLHLTDFFAKKLMLDPETVRNEACVVSKALESSNAVSRLYAELRSDNPGRSIIVLNWFASTHIKSLPPHLLSNLTKEFPEVVFLVAHPEFSNKATEHDLKAHNFRAINLSSRMKSLHDYFTAVRLSDAVICSDTSTYHIASLYDIPSLVLIGPTYSILTKYYYCCSFIEAHYVGNTCNSPCGRSKGDCTEAKKLGTPYSPCLLSISENIVHDKFRELMDAHLLG
jgi:ADP-heptose:LPS heptosyltransferase